jgi:hypothetical protein
MAKKSVKTGALGPLRMPGFTAEASLSKSREPYRMLGTLNPPNATQVVPQMCAGGRYVCEWYLGEQICYWQCHYM